MHEVIDMIEAGRFTEEQVLDSSLEFDILYAAEPYQFALVRTVEECRTESLRFAYTDRVPFGDLSDDLNVRVLVIQFGYLVETTAVDIFVRILTNEIERSIDTELFTKNVGTFGTDILTIAYITTSQIHDY